MVSHGSELHRVLVREPAWSPSQVGVSTVRQITVEMDESVVSCVSVRDEVLTDQPGYVFVGSTSTVDNQPHHHMTAASHGVFEDAIGQIVADFALITDRISVRIGDLGPSRHENLSDLGFYKSFQI